MQFVCLTALPINHAASNYCILVNKGTGKDVEEIEHGFIQCIILASASKRKSRKCSVRIVDVRSEIRKSTFWVRVRRFAAWPNWFSAASMGFSLPLCRGKDGPTLFSMVQDHDHLSESVTYTVVDTLLHRLREMYFKPEFCIQDYYSVLHFRVMCWILYLFYILFVQFLASGSQGFIKVSNFFTVFLSQSIKDFINPLRHSVYYIYHALQQLKLSILPTDLIYYFRTTLKINIIRFPEQTLTADLSNGEAVSALCKRDWSFVRCLWELRISYC
jgi:hypothetical protein